MSHLEAPDGVYEGAFVHRRCHGRWRVSWKISEGREQAEQHASFGIRVARPYNPCWHRRTLQHRVG
jgi:hypothetical protein